MNKKDINKLNLFLSNGCITDNEEVISVYSLYKLLNEYFEDFRILRYGNDKMINSMNNEYSFVDRIKNSMINPWFRKIFVSEFNDDFIKIIIIVNPIYRRKEFPTNNIYYYVVKDRKSGNIYFENNVLKNRVFDKFYQEIINIFSLAEIYTDIFMLDKRDFPIYHQTFDLDNVGASVDYNNFGNVSSYIIYDGKICSNNEIKDIKNDILKRIPVYTGNLDVISSYIVNEQRKAKIRKKEY